MRYEKPIVMDLGARERISGGCVSGKDATEAVESCGTGTGAGWSCQFGEDGFTGYPLCATGSNTGGMGDCLSGTNAPSCYCESGGSGDDDPTGCDFGPSYT